MLSCSLVFLFSCSSDYLVKNEQSVYQIVLDEPDNPHQIRAAKLMQHYVNQLTGVIVPIGRDSLELAEHILRISLDNDCHPDGFTLGQTEEGFLIKGGTHKGCIYGVIYLLEQEWGCRKYSPDFEVIPKHKGLILPDDEITNAPKNNYRIINGRFGQDADYQDWQAIDVIQDQFANRFYVHTFNRLIPWEEHLDDHPEYYSEVNGRRIKDQLCLTNPDVLRITIAHLREEIKKQPDKHLWSVSQNDNFSYCQCEDCQKIIDEEGTAAGPIIRFVNKIADEFPDQVISTLAYQYSRQAPKITKPRDNVQIMLCTIELSRSLPIADEPRSASFLKDLEDWGKIAKLIYLWDYTVNFSHHISPFPNYHVLQPNIQLFTENHVHEHFQQSNTDTGHEFSELKSYLIAHLLWDPYTDVDSLIQDFTHGYYGDAAPLVLDYFHALQDDIANTGEWLDIYGHPTAHESTFLAEEKVNRYLKLFEQAQERVLNDSARLIHVKTAALPIQYAAMEIGKNHMFESRGWYTIEDDQYTPRQTMLDCLNEFIATCRQAGVNTVNESGLLPEAYYEATMRFIDVQVEGNLAFRKQVTADPQPAVKYSRGDLSYLSNGVQGASDYKVHWLGWEAQDFTLTLDLEQTISAEQVSIGTLYDPKSWIFHPKEISCSFSIDGLEFNSLDINQLHGDQSDEPVTRTHFFTLPDTPIRYIRFHIKGTHANPGWHPSAGGKSWVFVDEIVVR